MAIIEDEFSRTTGKPLTRSKTDGVGTPARSRSTSGDQVVYQKEARAPRGRKAVYVDVLIEARLTQAAAELGRTRDDMANEAVREYLKREAARLFEREFAAEQEEASHSRKPTPQRWEFERLWRHPAWTRE